MSTKPTLASSDPRLGLSDMTAAETDAVAPAAGPVAVGPTDVDDAADARPDAADLDILDLVRLRLDLDDDVSNVTIAASVAAIAAREDHRGRWLAAFGSPLGRTLAARGHDLKVALDNLIALSVSRAS